MEKILSVLSIIVISLFLSAGCSEYTSKEEKQVAPVAKICPAGFVLNPLMDDCRLPVCDPGDDPDCWHGCHVGKDATGARLFIFCSGASVEYQLN